MCVTTRAAAQPACLARQMSSTCLRFGEMHRKSHRSGRLLQSKLKMRGPCRSVYSWLLRPEALIRILSDLMKNVWQKPQRMIVETPLGRDISNMPPLCPRNTAPSLPKRCFAERLGEAGILLRPPSPPHNACSQLSKWWYVKLPTYLGR